MSEGGGLAPQMSFIDELILEMLDPEVVDGIQNSQTEAGVVSIYIFNFEVIHDLVYKQTRWQLLQRRNCLSLR